MIRKNSKKRAKQMRDYSIVRLEYLDSHPVCEVCGQAHASEIHHQAGKVGERLTDKKHFLAVCRQCHFDIETHPDWAKKKGYSISRLSTI